MVPRPYRIRDVRRETADTFTLDMVPEDGLPPSFAPGQFNMLYRFGVGEVPISICGDPSKTDVLVHTIRDVGAVTHAMHELKAGTVLGVRGPFGSGWPVERARQRDVVILAGGVGMAPLRPVVRAIVNDRGAFGRVSLLYGSRTDDDLLYQSEFDAWRAAAIDLEVTVDRASPAWDGNVGVVTTLLRLAKFDPSKAVAMICGPEIMMRFCMLELRKRGMKDDDIYLSVERNMKCAVGFCGHCQFGPTFICRDGPVFPYSAIQHWFEQREI